MEVRALRTNTTIVTTKFLYEHIVTRFGCPLTIVINQDTHFINDASNYLIDHFVMRHTSFTVYYPPKNGQMSLQTRFLEPY